jgi:hypothetical protein
MIDNNIRIGFCQRVKSTITATRLRCLSVSTVYCAGSEALDYV